MTPTKEDDGRHAVCNYELSFRPDAVPTAVVSLDKNQRQVRGLNLRRSKRWMLSLPGVKPEPYHLPHFDRLGRYTGTSKYTLACEPPDVLSISVATVFGRLKRYTSAHNPVELVKPRLRDILRAAAYYVLSKNSYFMDRLLYFLRNLKSNGKLIHRTMLYYLARSDADKRFVYGQVCFQTNWLIFRAAKPRDKSLYLKLVADKFPEYLDYRDTRRPCRYGYVRLMSTTLAEGVAGIGRSMGEVSLTV
jgi:hypothetical protein